MSPPPIRDIALVRLSALGDAAMILSVVRTLQRALPQARITWIIGRAAHGLVSHTSGVEFIVLDKPRSLADYLRFRRAMRARRFDVLLALQASLRANLLYPWIHAPLKIGFDRIRARDGQWLFTNRRIPHVRQHLMESFLAFARAIGIEEEIHDCALVLTEEDRRWANEAIPDGNAPLLVVNPGASKSERNWSATGYARVIEEARQRWGVRVLLTGAAQPRDVCLSDSIRAQCAAGVATLVGQSTPRQLAAVLEIADCVLAPDTGPAHIAAAMATPVVGLYAVAPSWLSAPYRYRHLVVDRYDQAVGSVLGLDPATVPWGTRVHDGRAMQLITVDEVMAKLAEVLG